MRIYLISAAKDKIKRFNITDPFISFLVYTYETDIDWSKITKENAESEINNQIETKLIPNLLQKIDPKSPNNNYIDKINIVKEIQTNWRKPEVAECKAVYIQDGREAAKQLRLSQLNDAKRNRFNDWKQYFMYNNYPNAFKYIMLKMAIELSKKNDKHPTIQVNHDIIEMVKDRIKEGNQETFNIKKAYQDALDKHNAVNMEIEPLFPGPNNGWLRIKSKKNDEENFEENVQKLVDYSTPNGWCTGYGQAVPYLSDGDFWLYLEDNHAKVAIRFNGNIIAEIRGQRNEPAYDYFEAIFSLIERKGFDKNSAYYKELEKAKQTNKNPTSIISFEDYTMLTKGNRQRVPERLLALLIEASCVDEIHAYKVAQFYNFDTSKIRNNCIINKITEEKTNTDNRTTQSQLWTWPPWKWVQSVSFDKSRIPDKVIECIAYNDFTAMEFAKWTGYDKDAIPEPILDKIAENTLTSFDYAKNALFDINSIPANVVNSIAKDSNLFVQFAVKSELDLTNIEETMMPIIIKSPELCALAAKNYNYDKNKIPEEMWKVIIGSPEASIKFSEGLEFNVSKIPEEIIYSITRDVSSCLKFSDRVEYEVNRIPKVLLDKIASSVQASIDYAKGTNYNFKIIPKDIIDSISIDAQISLSICNNLNFEIDKIPPQIIQGVANSSEMASEFSKMPNYNINKLPDVIIKSIAQDVTASWTFAVNRRYNVPEIPTEIIESIATNGRYSFTFASTKIKAYMDKKFRERGVFNLEQEIPKPIINGIARNPGNSLELSKLLDFNVLKIPEVIKDSIGINSKTAMNFAIGVSYNYAKMTPKMVESIASDPVTSYEFIEGVNFDKTLIDPRMINSIILQNGVTTRFFIQKIKFDFSEIDPKQVDALINITSQNPVLCMGFVSAKNAIPDQIPQPIMQSVISNHFISSYYAEAARYNPQKIPQPIIDSICQNPSYAYNYAKGCKFNFNIIPNKIIKSVSQDPKLLLTLKQKYAEFKKNEQSLKGIQTQPQKTITQQPPKQPIEQSKKEENLAISKVKITKIANKFKEDNMPNNSNISNVKITKIAKEEKVPDAETLALCVLTLKVYLKDNENLAKEYKDLISKLPSPRQIRQSFSNKECEVLYETVNWLWVKIIGQNIVSEENIQKAPEKMCGNYLMINNGILLKGTNTYDIIKRNTTLLCSLLNIGGITLLEYLSGNHNALIKYIIKSGAVRLFVTKDGRLYGQTSPLTYGRWARKKIQKLDFKKKVLKVIDLSQKYDGWKSGITIML